MMTLVSVPQSEVHRFAGLGCQALDHRIGQLSEILFTSASKPQRKRPCRYAPTGLDRVDDSQPTSLPERHQAPLTELLGIPVTRDKSETPIGWRIATSSKIRRVLRTLFIERMLATLSGPGAPELPSAAFMGNRP